MEGKYGLNQNLEKEAHSILQYQKRKQIDYEKKIKLYFTGG